jgi:hypothetical protein
MPAKNRFFLRCSPRVVGSFAIGKLRVHTGATSLRATLTVRSQKGNIAHEAWSAFTSRKQKNAAAEYDRHNRGLFQPVTTYFADVQLRRVLDLCDANALAAVGLMRRDLQTPWVGARRLTPTQLLGEAVSQQSGIAAIRFPSEAAREKGFSGANVVIFRDCLRRPDHVHILGPTKKALQKWP